MNNSITNTLDNMLGHYSSFTQALHEKNEGEILDLAFKIAIAAVAKVDKEVFEEEFSPKRPLEIDEWAEEIMYAAYNAYHKLQKTDWEH